MLDRTTAPSIQPISEMALVEPKTMYVTEHVPIHWMNLVPNETARLELIFDAGLIRAKKGLASFVNHLLFTGNSELSSTQIHAEIDFLGAFHGSNIGNETASVSIYALRENFPKLVRTIHKALSVMSCEEKEIQDMLKDRRQRFLVNMEKTKYLAQRTFQNKLYGENSSYAEVAELSFYENVDRLDLQNFYAEHYLKGITSMNLVGNFERDFVESVAAAFRPWCKTKLPQYEKDLKNTAGTFHIEKPEAMQTAIRIGRTLFNKTHEDFIDFQILNTILGDYFGSRLMTNIREEKGYTYGIGSMLGETKHFGYLLIATEVAKEFTEDTLKEIQKEFERLKTELVPSEELDLVKNYLLGQMLKSADGPYAMMDLYLAVEWHGMDYGYYNEVLKRLDQITPERLQTLAQKYLVWEEMTVVTAG